MSAFLEPRPSSNGPNGAIGEPRGEEFDLASLDEPGEPPAFSGATKWSWPWIALAGVLALYIAYFWVYGLGYSAQKPLPLGPIKSQGTPAPLRVHVAGGVKTPGVYELKAGQRIEDALKKAGGALPGADPNALNLADFVEDGTKISVPLRPTPAPQTTPTPVVIVREVPVPAPATPSSLETAPSLEFGSVPPPASAPRPSIAKTPGGAESDNSSEAFLRKNPVDLNRATSEQLQKLPGVGPKMAERIIAYRAENGRFKSVGNLDEVKGIGEKRMEQLKDLVVVR